MQIKNIGEGIEIVKTLMAGGMTDHPFVREKCKAFTDTGDIHILEQLLNDFPLLLDRAIRNTEIKAILEEQEPFRKFYHEDMLSDLAGQLTFGLTIPGESPVGIDPVSLTEILCVYGAPGTGKTRLFVQLLRRIFGLQDRNFNVIVLDVKPDYLALTLENPNLLVLGPQDLYFNILEEMEGWRKAVQVVADENYFGATSLPILEAAVRRCQLRNGLIDGEYFTDSDNYPTLSEIIPEVVNYCASQKLQGFGTADAVAKIKTRLDQFIGYGDMFNCRVGYPLDFWLNNDILICPADQISKPVLRTFMVGLASRIYRHYKMHNLRGRQLRTLFVMDEGGWLFDAERDNQSFSSTESLDELLRMGREFGLGWMIGAQQPNMISKTVRQNARSLITFGVQSESMSEVQKDFGLDDDQKKFMMHRLEKMLVAIYQTPEYQSGPVMFGVNEDKAPLEKNVNMYDVTDKMLPILEALKSKVKVGPKVKIDLDPPDSKSGKKEGKTSKDGLDKLREIMHADTKRILEILRDDPYLYKTPLWKAVGVNQQKFNRSLTWLLENGFLTQMECKSSAKKSAVFYPLTAKAHDLLKTPKSKRKPSERLFRHTYYCQRVKEYLEKQGLKPVLEYQSWEEDSFTLGKGGKEKEVPLRIDVFCKENGKKIAYEVIRTDHYYLEVTAYKCFVKMGMDEMQVICEDKSGLEKAEKQIGKMDRKILPDKGVDRIKVRLITDFL